jgi:predicted ATPase/Tfp pilus assembly protein PilF
MRLYALAGQRAWALRQWVLLAAALRRDLDAAPVPAAQSLRDEIAAGRFPPTDVIAAEARPGRHKGNLPIPLTALIGREADLLAAKAALGRARLLTLTGAGGCGKTRLALAAATDLLAAYPGGVWLVELAALADPALVPVAIAAAFAVREEAGRPLLTTIAERLAEQATLLVLDNCEHLRDACAAVVSSLLATCPRLRVLATSRAALGLPDEAVWRVPSLRVPPTVTATTPRRVLAELAAVPAVRLFLERVRQRQPAFALTPANAQAVAEIARRLDGIPLALELAAARVAILPVEELVARLDDALPLLTGGARATTPRQRTLRATLDWSYKLLAPPHRVLLHRLSVFASGCTLAAIEAVCAELRIENPVVAGASEKLKNDPQQTGTQASSEPFSIFNSQFSILDALADLADHSLVQVDLDAAEGRYHLLETVRQYGGEHLAASGERDTIQRRHAAYYLALAERAEGAILGQEGLTWLDRLELEHDNFRAALGRMLALGEYETGLRLAGALTRFWYMRGHLREGRDWLAALLARATAVAMPVRAKGTYGLGYLAYFQSDLPTATAWVEEGVALWRATDDKRGLAGALNLLAIISTDTGDYPRASTLYADCLALQRAIGDQHGIGRTLHNQAAVARHQGERQRARALYEEAIAIWRAGGDIINTSTALLNLGQLLQELGDYARAEAALNESLALPAGKGNPATVAYALNSLGTGARDCGDHARARHYHDQALATFRELGDKTSIARTLISLAQIAYDTGDDDQAAAYTEESLALARESGHQRNTAHALLALGDIARRHGDHGDARDRYVESLRSFQAAGNPLGVTQTLEHLGLLAAQTGQTEEASKLLGVSAARRDQMGTPAPPVERAELERTAATLRQRLGAATFAALWAAGQALIPDEAIAAALAGD